MITPSVTWRMWMLWHTPAGRGAPIPLKVVKGGCHLCARFNTVFVIDRRRGKTKMIDTSTSHIGFRVVQAVEMASL